MKTIIWRAWLYAVLLGAALYASAAVVTPPLSTTPLTRGFLTNTTAVGAINALGISQTNAYGFGTDQFSVTGSNVVFKAASGITNPILYGTGTRILGVTNAGTTTNWTFNAAGPTTVARLIDVTNSFDGFSNSAILYVSQAGNDTTAVRGKPNKPWLTISNALRVLTNGDTLKIMPGWYTNTAVMHMGNGDAPWLVQNLTNVTIDAWGANTYWPTGVSMMVIKKCNGVSVKGLGFHNNKGTLNPPQWMTNYIAVAPGTWAALTIVNSEHILVEGCRFKDIWDHGIVANGDCAGNVAGDNSVTNNICVTRCSFENLGWYWSTWPDGAAIVPGPGQKITDNYIVDTTRGIEVYPIPDTDNSAETRSITIVGNHLTRIKGEAIMAIRLGGGVIAGNTIDNPLGYPADASFDYGIRVEYCQGVQFSGNSIRNRAVGIVFLGPVTNCSFSENVLRMSSILISGVPIIGCRFTDNIFSDMGFAGIGGNNNWQGNEFSRNRFVNVGTNNSQSPIYYNSGAGTCVSNVFDGNTFSTIFVNTKPTVTIEVGGTVSGNIYGQNFMLPGYTIPWAAPAGGITNANISGGQGYFSGTVYATNGVVSGGVVSWPTNTVNTPPVFALGQFGYWNSNGLMLWKCWNTNGTTVCAPTP